MTLFRYAVVLGCCVLGACGAIAGVDDFSLSASVDAGAISCSSHRDCSRAASASGAAFCLQPVGHCVALTSPDCSIAAGPADNDHALLVGSLFSTKGAQASVNMARQQSVQLAIEELNAAGGIPLEGRTQGSPLVLVACDESSDLMRAARHLIDDLDVSAIIGPNTSQDTLDLATQLSTKAGTLLITPTGVASKLAQLSDDDLVWQMAPDDAQRGPLMIREINELEADLHALRGSAPLKLATVFRDDALGIGAQAALETLRWNGAELNAESNKGTHVRSQSYEPGRPDQSALVRTHLAYAPDVIVLIGTGEAVSDILAPLEAGWSKGPHPDAPRPQYVLTDSSKVPELLALVAENPELATRVRGTGVTASPESEAVRDGFRIDYAVRFPTDVDPSSSGLGTSYDATYAVAYALVGEKPAAISGSGVARGLRRLDSGLEVPLQQTTILSGFREIARTGSIAALGTQAPLVWDERGAVAAGRVEIWCVSAASGSPVYVSSGVSADIPSQEVRGDNHLCGAASPAAYGGGNTTPPKQPASASDTPVPNSMVTPMSAPAPSAGSAAAGAGGEAPEPPSSAGAAGSSGSSAGPMTAGAAGAAGSAAVANDPLVPCGTKQCDPRSGEYCCTKTLRGGTGTALPNDFSCETAPAECAVSTRCHKDNDCGQGEVCCVTLNNVECTQAAECTSGHLGCTSSSDCLGNIPCCWGANSGSGLLGSSCNVLCMTPAPTTGPRTGTLCESDLECTLDNPVLRCSASASFPSLRACY